MSGRPRSSPAEARAGGVERLSVAAASIGGVTSYDFEGELWQWKARGTEPGSWYFVSLPYDVADEIEAVAPPKGFGSVRVEVTVGATTWRTSVFPSAEEKTYVLPVKKQVREREGLGDGATCSVTLRPL